MTATPPPRSGARPAPSRRQVLGGALAGAAALGLSGLAAACSGSDDEAGAATSTSEARTTTPAPAAPPRPDASDGPPSAGPTKVVVLGSQGGQQITQLTGAGVRAGSSIAIDVDGEVTVLDCGVGSLHRLAEAGYDANQVRNVLVTHCHADHVAELGSFATFSWSSGRNGDDTERRLDVYGPTGVLDYQAGMKRSLRLSLADQEGPLAQRPVFDEYAYWHEVEPPTEMTTLFTTDRVEVRAIGVHHGGLPSVGYRVTTAEVDIAFSGDRGAEGDAFASLVEGADVLFHEVIDRELVQTTLEGQGAAPSFIDHLVDDHTDAADVGRLATEAGVGTLVLYHLIPGNPALTDEDWISLVRPTFAGEVVVARDLLVL